MRAFNMAGPCDLEMPLILISFRKFPDSLCCLDANHGFNIYIINTTCVPQFLAGFQNTMVNKKTAFANCPKRYPLPGLHIFPGFANKGAAHQQ